MATSLAPSNPTAPDAQNAPLQISVWRLCGAFCVAASDGEKLRRAITRALKDERSVAVSFEGVESLASAFLNASVGQLVGQFDAQILRDQLQIEDLSDSDHALVRRVVQNAKRYFADPERFKAAQDAE